MSIKCSEKACPFAAVDGTELCRQHQRFFAWDYSMTDRAIDYSQNKMAKSGNSEDSGVNSDGLYITPSRRLLTESEKVLNKHATVIRVRHQYLAGGRLIKGVLPAFNGIGDEGLRNLFGNPFVAEDLLISTRFPNGAFCTICGHEKLGEGKYYASVTSRKIFRCPMCRHQQSVTALSIMHQVKLELNYWLRAMHLMKEQPNFGVITVMAKEFDCSYKSAWRVHDKLKNSAESVGGVGIPFGFGNDSAVQLNHSASKQDLRAHIKEKIWGNTVTNSGQNTEQVSGSK